MISDWHIDYSMSNPQSIPEQTPMPRQAVAQYSDSIREVDPLLASTLDSAVTYGSDALVSYIFFSIRRSMLRLSASQDHTPLQVLRELPHLN